MAKQCRNSGTAAPLVSIVIPFYNLENEAPMCLDAVLRQSFKDYEIVCVDDGSSDKTPEILDDYADSHACVRVIHKPNGGLSDARNVGVANSRGEYITFIDGDDIVAPCYLEALVTAMDGKKGRLVAGPCKAIPVKDMGRAVEMLPTSVGAQVISREEACRRILVKDIPTLAQAKLYPVEYYREHPFPLGVRYEEIRTIGKLVADADEVSVLDAPIYGYIIREGSIVRASNATTQQGMEYVEAIETACDDLRVLGYDLGDELAFFRAIMYTRVHDFAKRIADPEGAAKVEKISREAVRQSYRGAMRCKDAPGSQKKRIMLYRYCPHLYDGVFSLYNKYVKGV